jgi:MoxR-like ATPase
MMKREQTSNELIIAARIRFGDTAVVSRKQLKILSKELGLRYHYDWLKEHLWVSRGKFDLGRHPELATVTPVKSHIQKVSAPVKTSAKFDPNIVTEHVYADVPTKSASYVPFGFYASLTKILDSKSFFPVFITGLSGNGKTLMVEQACAKANRPLIRIQMSAETDEDDLIGGFRLVAGETRYIKGPVIMAMEMGAVMLIDEVDRADQNKIMCIQGILEGKPYYMKKTGEIVQPCPGFTVVVTANTKGRGSENGLYTAAKILDDAWLERFPITIEQEFPSVAIERKILTKYAESIKSTVDASVLDKFIESLTMWASVIRKSYAEDAVDNVISTRRLTHILQTFLVFGDKMEAIRLCVSRYDEDTKVAFLELFGKVSDETPTVVPVESMTPAESGAVPVS